MSFEAAKEKLADYIERNGLRHSDQREKVLAEFLSSSRHLTAEELYERVRKKYPELGQATVYRALKLFREAGICRALELAEGPTRFEPLTGSQHHDHLVCVNCGRFEEVVDDQIEELQEELAEARGYKLKSHRLVLNGLCPECQKQQS